MRKLLSSSVAALLAATTALVAGSAAPTSAAAAASKPVPTAFALSGKGFGTRATGGDIPAGSDTTAFQAIGCTNLAGKDSRNHVAEMTLPGAGTISAITTRNWTTKRKGVVSSRSRASTAKVVLTESDLGTLSIDGLTSKVRAYHEDGEYKTSIKTRIGALIFTDPTGAEQELEAPTPDQPLIIPDFAEVHVGIHKDRVRGDGAVAKAEALQIQFLPTDTRVKVAHAEARIAGGIKRGRFTGRGSAIEGTGLAGNLSVGRQPLAIMPCQGTDGKLRSKSTAHLDLPGAVSVDGLQAQQKAKQTMEVARGFELGRVARVDIGDGEIVVEGIVGKATVVRSRSQVKRQATGTEVGTVTIGGEVHEFPDSDVIEIPGLVKLERKIVEKTKSGIEVVALRITLLDGTGAVIDLGHVRMVVYNSKR